MLHDIKDLDVRLKAASAAAGTGGAISNVTGGHSGNAPDLGGLELEGPLPHYGLSSSRHLPKGRPSQFIRETNVQEA